MDSYGAGKGATSKAQFTSTGRAVMQKKFKINDGANAFVEVNTLLEPSNNATAQQHDKEEIMEVSVQLSQIKKKHDEAKKLVTLKQEEYDRIRKEIAGLEIQEAQIEGPIAYNKERLAQLNQSLDETQDKIDKENMARRTYLHMIERMNKDFIATKIKTNDLEKSIRNKQQVLEIEESKTRKTKEEKLQSKNIFDNLMKNIEKEQRDRQERILELQRCIANKEESVKRRIERQKKNQEIAETAANESKDSTELKMRNYLYINKLWNNFMKRKMHKEMESSRSIDEAFKQIKTHTGVTDVQAMVRRFQQREQTYTGLLQTVSSSEAKVDSLKKDNEELTKKLQELQIDAADNEETKAGAVDPNDAEIIQMNQDLTLVNRDYAQIQERFKKINIVNDQVSNWAKRCFQKFGTLTMDPLFQQEPIDLVSIFESMDTVVTRTLDELKSQEEQVEGVDYGEVFTDFATPEFLDKNVRVRPVSGITHGDETRDGRQSNISRGMGGIEQSQDDGDLAFNQGAASDLELQRNAIKAKKAAQDEVERKKKAAEEKAKRDR